MVDFIKRRLRPQTTETILVAIDPNKKISFPFSQTLSVLDVLEEISKNNDQQIIFQTSKSEPRHYSTKQLNTLVICVKEKKGDTWKRVVHRFELIRNLREFPFIDSIEFEVLLLPNPYLDSSRKTIFLGAQSNNTDQFILKGPLEKRSSKSDKFKKKQMSLFANYIQYMSSTKTKMISLENIIQILADIRYKHTFSLLMSNKVQPYLFKAESELNMKKWVSSIQQSLNQFRDMKHIQQLEEDIATSNRTAQKSLSAHTNRYLYHLESIVHHPYLVNRIYRTIQGSLDKLIKFDRDMLFQVISVNEGSENFQTNMIRLHEYFTQFSNDSPFKAFLDKTNLLDIFTTLFSEQALQQQLQQQTSDNTNILNDQSLEIETSMYGSSTMKSSSRIASGISRVPNKKPTRTYNSNTSNAFSSGLNNSEQSIIIALDSQVKWIPKVLDRLNYIFIEYLISQYRSTFRFSEIISRSLCEFRISHNHFTPSINVFQHQFLEPNERPLLSYISQVQLPSQNQPIVGSSQEYNNYSQPIYFFPFGLLKCFHSAYNNLDGPENRERER